MTPDQISALAEQAHLPACHLTHPKALARFAALVQEAEKLRCREVLMALHAKSIRNHNYYLHAVRALEGLDDQTN